MKAYFAHNGVDDGHPNVYTNTVDTTVPGPAEPKPKSNTLMIVSVVVVVVVAIVIIGEFIYKKIRKPTAKVATKSTESEPAMVKPTNKA